MAFIKENFISKDESKCDSFFIKSECRNKDIHVANIQRQIFFLITKQKKILSSILVNIYFYYCFKMKHTYKKMKMFKYSHETELFL